MKEQLDKVNEVAHKLAQTMYSQAQEEGEASTEPQADSSGDDNKSDDDVVDAEFEDVGKK